MKTETIKFKSFMNGEYSLQVAKIKEIKKQRIYKIVLAGGLTAIVFITTGLDPVSAATASSTGIDKAAYAMYKKLLNISKWIIIVKGAIDTVNNMIKHDHDAAKKSFITYLIVYIIIKGLPWAMGQVDGLFDGFEEVQ